MRNAQAIRRGRKLPFFPIFISAAVSRYRSGLERSAVGGAGFGIERFRPVRQEITVGFKMRVELDKALGRTATRALCPLHASDADEHPATHALVSCAFLACHLGHEIIQQAVSHAGLPG